MTIATETHLSAQNVFLSEKNLLLHVMMMKKVNDWGFLAFWPFENDQKFRRKCKNVTNNLKFDKKWVSTTTGTSTKPWNVRTYCHHHTSYYTNHQFPIINTNPFVIPRCELSLFLNRTVLFICFMTNVSPMRKLFVPNTTKLQFYCEYNCERETAPCLQIITITW